LIKQEPLAAAYFVLSAGSTLLIGAVVGWIAIRLYQREAILG
jgi:hypothetical protein